MALSMLLTDDGIFATYAVLKSNFESPDRHYQYMNQHISILILITIMQRRSIQINAIQGKNVMLNLVIMLQNCRKRKVKFRYHHFKIVSSSSPKCANCLFVVSYKNIIFLEKPQVFYIKWFYCHFICLFIKIYPFEIRISALPVEGMKFVIQKNQKSHFVWSIYDKKKVNMKKIKMEKFLSNSIKN